MTEYIEALAELLREIRLGERVLREVRPPATEAESIHAFMIVREFILKTNWNSGQKTVGEVLHDFFDANPSVAEWFEGECDTRITRLYYIFHETYLMADKLHLNPE